MGTLSARRRRNLRNEVIALATTKLRRRLEARLDLDAAFDGLIDDVVARRLDPASAANAILEDELM
jgi:LAO/AO transport system kinase